MTARVQNKGLDRITAALAALNWYAQWGTGSGANAAANAVTTTSTSEARVLATAAQGTTNVANDALTLVATIVAAATRAITELGIFDGAGTGSPPTGGNMDVYFDFSAINLAAGDSIAFSAKVTFA